MTVADLKAQLEAYDDRAEIFYYDPVTGEDAPMQMRWIVIEDAYEGGEVNADSD